MMTPPPSSALAFGIKPAKPVRFPLSIVKGTQMSFCRMYTLPLGLKRAKVPFKFAGATGSVATAGKIIPLVVPALKSKMEEPS